MDEALTPDQLRDLESARHLIQNGVPVFLAAPHIRDETWVEDGGHHGTGYWLPKGWQLTLPDESVLDKWKPGWALCAVMGHTVDLLDIDTRSGGTESLESMRKLSLIPRSYGRQATPSGGTHDMIACLNVRSLDKVLPGVDVKAGDAEGRGRGFAFIAPTVKLSKSTGALIAYRWDLRPDITAIALVGGDETGLPLAQRIRDRHSRDYHSLAPYEGPPYEELSQTEKSWADDYVRAETERWTTALQEALEHATDSSWRNDKNRGWEALSYTCAWALARIAASPWTGLTEEQAEKIYYEIMPEEIINDPKCAGKWDRGLVNKAASRPADSPGWRDFAQLAIPENPSAQPTLPPSLTDGLLVTWVANATNGLQGKWRWTPVRGWMFWDGKRWKDRHLNDATEAVRQVFERVVREALSQGMTGSQLTTYANLLDQRKIRRVISLLSGYVSIADASFDRHSDLLNCHNGIVDLRTGALIPHDPKYHLTRITQTPYVHDAHHKDWDQTLQALEPEVIEWMQLRFGNAITGYATSDHKIPVCQGSGSNGKTNLLNALFAALGGHIVKIPDKLLTSNPNDSATEMMELLGARLAVIDETPEEGKLNTQRLKAISGQEQMKGRRLYQNNISWKATHSIFLLTNHLPSFSSTDDGTWRRLVLVKFEKSFPRDDAFFIRVASGSDGRSEAVLRWLVEGATKWYARAKQMPDAPPLVEKHTEEWRAEIDLLVGYFSDRIQFDPSACVMVREMWDDMNTWLVSRGHVKWSERLFTTRLSNHRLLREQKLEKKQAKTKKIDGLVRLFDTATTTVNHPVILQGVRWREES